ncbi:ParM/StbA family protein [Clostridium senegalense]|uniref:ParM/StbA family protein n=1 Tax=Clostridium senegalense TaxID=1465809 RepID=UPI001C121943|nr:ParM/StbA family protein [Clostridium senegalense]MBU5227876.1 ParM/StbA family protein [Clostridium senegalense]
MLIGVDLGNFGVKTSERVSFFSKISEIESFTDNNEIIYEGNRIYVGEGEFSTDWNKSLKDTTLPLLFTALAKSSKENIFQVVLGLPIQQYKKNKYNLKDLIEGNRGKSITIDGVTRDIIISDIEIAPEGASAYYNLSLENKKIIGSKQLIIVDIGGRTTDVCLFKESRIQGVKTIPVGMMNVYTDIVDEVNSKFTESFKLEEGENILREGLFLYGEQQDVSFIKAILQRHFNSIYKELQLNFELAKGYVLLTGGGSLIFERAFKNRLKNLIISDDPLFDNVMGFKKVGEQLWLER